MSGRTEITLAETLTRRWKLTVAIVLACTVAGALVTKILPHHYEAEMKFLVNNERTDLVITPRQEQTSVPTGEVSETEVNSEIELMNSHDILSGVATDEKLYLPFQQGKSGPPERKSLELATLKLRKAFAVSALHKTNVIDVTYRDQDPEAAIRILQDIGDRYSAFHLLAHSAQGTNQFFTEEVRRYSEELNQARAALATFHEQEGLFAFPQQQTALVERLQSVSTQLEDVRTKIAIEKTRIAGSSNALTTVPARQVTQVKEVSDQLALEQLEPVLTQLENRRIELATKLKPSDRLVQQLDDQITQTKSAVARLRTERQDEKTTDINPLHQNISADYTKSGIDLKALETEQGSLSRIRQANLSKLSTIDQSYSKMQGLEQQEKQAQDNYELYTRRLEEVRAAEALDRDKFSNVVMIQKPTVSPIAVSPNLGLDTAAGFIFGLLLAGLLAFKMQHDLNREWIPSSSNTPLHNMSSVYATAKD